MKHNVVAPSVGESITEVSILKWNKNAGELVNVGEKLLEIESDKATVEVVAEAKGVLSILKPEGERIAIGTKIAEIDDAATPTASASKPQAAAAPTAPKSAPASAPQMMASPGGAVATGAPLSPAVRKMVTETGVNPSQISGTGKGGRLTKGDVMDHLASGASAAGPARPVKTPSAQPQMADRPGDRRVKMSMLRAKIAERLVQAQHTAAILTTFNEVDMGPVMEIRNKYKDKFKAKYGTGLGFMSFFTRACIEALKQIPEVNATIDGGDVVYHDYQDVGIAVGTERGLVVPIVRDAGNLSIPQIELKIAEMAIKARDGKLSIADMSGGTFTISNGGVYGSLLSTPILNPPQSAILGMHKIQERPMVVNGQVVARPMMYLALSYDHRLIDGKGAVTFLVTVRDCLENPQKLGLESLNDLG